MNMCINIYMNDKWINAICTLLFQQIYVFMYPFHVPYLYIVLFQFSALYYVTMYVLPV